MLPVSQVLSLPTFTKLLKMSSSYFGFFFFFFIPAPHARPFVVSCVGLVPVQAFCPLLFVSSLLFILVCSYKMLLLHCRYIVSPVLEQQVLPSCSLHPPLFLSPSPFSAHASLPAKDECYTGAHPGSRTEARCLSFHLGRWGNRYH